MGGFAGRWVCGFVDGGLVNWVVGRSAVFAVDLRVYSLGVGRVVRKSIQIVKE